MKCKVFVFIFIFGYLMIYCNGEKFTSSTSGSSVDSSPSEEGVSSTYGIRSGDGISSKDIISSTDSSSSTNGISSTDGKSSTVSSTDGVISSDVTSSIDGISSTDDKGSSDGISSFAGRRFKVVRSLSEGLSSIDEISTTTTLPVEISKKVIIKDVLRKICLLAKKTLKDAKPEERPAILENLENKLVKASQGAGKSSRQSYVQTIIKGIRTLAERNDYSVCEEENKNEYIVNLPTDLILLTSSTLQPKQQSNRLITEPQVPIAHSQHYDVTQELFKNMFEKLEKIVNKSLKNITTPEAKMKVLEKIKNKLLELTNRMNDNTLRNINPSHIDLILKGINWTLNNDIDQRRMTFKKIDKEKERREPGVMHFKHNYGNTQSTPSALMTPSGVTTEYDCSAIQKNICNSINNLNEFICSYDDTVISVEKICDDRMDCPDGSDEKDCVQQDPSVRKPDFRFFVRSSCQLKDIHCWTKASPKDLHDDRSCAAGGSRWMQIQRLPPAFTKLSVYRLGGLPTQCLPLRGRHSNALLPHRPSVLRAISRVHNATEIMKDVGLAKGCLFPLIESSMFNKQVKMMSEVLTNEISFINKYKQRFPSRGDKEKARELDHRSLVEVTSDVCFLLRSFVIAMDGALCTDTLQSVDEMVKKLSEPIERTLAEDIDMPLKDFKMKTCDCNGPFCVNMTCPIGCRRICFQRNSLMLWSCKATDGSNGVTLDLICDGKFDCYDETDETGCVLYNSAAKFEANRIYDSVLKTIRSIMSHFGFEMARSQLGQLHDTIRTLQIKSMNPKTPSEEFKKFRDKAFLLIVEIFDESLNSVAVELKADSALEYLESIKEKLIVALKKTFTGNKKIIAPDGCFCRGLECAVPVCSRKCIRTCMSKPKLTKYLCSSTTSTSIPLEQICNGKKNCPRGEDEDKCKPELCRRHHVVELRNKLTKVGEKHAGTVLGEVLNNWRSKALANLRILESQERPTANDFKIAMSEMLEHLVVSYATLEDFRRFKSGTLILNKFEKLAQRMMETLKSCSK